MDQKFELRALKASDFVLVTRILSKIGIKEFKAIIESDSIKSAIGKMAAEQGGEMAQADVASIGMTVVFDIASVVLERMEECEGDIYELLSRLSGLKKNEVAELPMADFGEMVIGVIKHEGFRDFFTAVIKQFK